MNAIFLLTGQVNTYETVITVNTDKLLSSLYALIVILIALAIFTLVICFQYRNAKKQIKELSNKQIENQYISKISKEERKIINLYNRLEASDKQSIMDMLKALNSKD